MGTLFVIGNGFDLHFGLKTGTEDFEDCLRAQGIEGEMDNAFEILNAYGVDWSEYEQSLADMDLDAIELENLDFPDYLSDRESDRDGVIFQMQEYLNSISDAISSALEEMVDTANAALEEMVDTANAASENEEIMESRSKLFQSGDAVISFNYTSTIEMLFDIPNDFPILHIHGYRANNEQLIFGYKEMKGNYHTRLEPDEDGDFYEDQQRQAIYEFYTGWQKKAKLKKLKRFLENCQGINQVVVLGHSMGEVDAKYMEVIEKVIHPTEWKISYYCSPISMKTALKQYSFEQKCDLFEFD